MTAANQSATAETSQRSAPAQATPLAPSATTVERDAKFAAEEDADNAEKMIGMIAVMTATTVESLPVMTATTTLAMVPAVTTVMSIPPAMTTVMSILPAMTTTVIHILPAMTAITANTLPVIQSVTSNTTMTLALKMISVTVSQINSTKPTTVLQTREDESEFDDVPERGNTSDDCLEEDH